MQTQTTKFQAAVQRSHQIATRFEVWSGIGGVLLGTLNPIGGSVTQDVKNAIRRQLSMTLTDPDGTLMSGSMLKPYGSEIRPYRGITFSDGTTEMFQLGCLGITDVKSVDASGDFVISVSGADRADKISRSKFRDFYTITAGTDLATALKAMIINQVPSLNSPAFFRFISTTGNLTPLITFKPGDDPWAEAQKLATAAGLDLYFDYSGVCTLALVPDPTTLSSLWTYADDAALSMMAKLETQITNRDVFNHWIGDSSGTGVSTPLRAEAWDSNPASPTFIGFNYGTPAWQTSAYGDVIGTLSVSTATTKAQLQAAVNAKLRQSLGLTQSVSLNALVNPAHLVNDVVTLTRAESNLKNVKVVFDALSIPFTERDQLQANLRMVV